MAEGRRFCENCGTEISNSTRNKQFNQFLPQLRGGAVEPPTFRCLHLRRIVQALGCDVVSDYRRNGAFFWILLPILFLGGCGVLLVVVDAAGRR